MCDPTDGPCSLPETAYYGCGGGVCGAPKCQGTSGDCNKDLADPECNTDGCEVEDIVFDPNNCGGCGIKCKTEDGRAMHQRAGRFLLRRSVRRERNDVLPAARVP